MNADPSGDIWQLGIIFYMILFNKYPFEGEAEECYMNIIANKWQLPEEQGYSSSVKIISKEAESLL